MPSVHCELFTLKIHFSLKYLSVVFSIITMNFVVLFLVSEVGFCLFRSAKKFKKKYRMVLGSFWFLFMPIYVYSSPARVPVTTNFHDIFRNTIFWSCFVAYAVL